MPALVTLHPVTIPTGTAQLHGDLAIPIDAAGIVLFAHGSGSSRFSHRNRFVAEVLQQHGLATLLFDLLTGEEAHEDEIDGRHRFDIVLLTSRLIKATDWTMMQGEIRTLPIGYFGASTGAAAALLAAVARAMVVQAVVSRGGRPDLALHEAQLVKAPTLLIVGERDREVLALNRAAYDEMRCVKRLVTVPGATHLFHETGALELVADFARDWFVTHLAARDVAHGATILQ